jgi:hypothetical protein
MAKKKQMRAPRAGVDADAVGFLRAMGMETDRGCWLVANAAIEEAMDRLLLSFFEMSRGNEDTDQEIDDLFNRQPLPVLGNFGVKTCLSRALGLIPADFCKYLDTMREQRNQFAHRTYLLEITPRDIQQLVNAVPAWKIKTQQILSPSTDWFWAEMLAKGDSKQLSKPRKTIW